MKIRGVAQLASVRIASGSSQGSPLLKTCFQRCGDGIAERDRGLAKPQPEYSTFQLYISSHIGVWRSWLARAVWDREVEGSSPFTPTKKKPVYVHRQVFS